jgi:AcrR family transcriptional regulator
VLQEAWDLLVERGLADLSLSELGRRLETSAGHLSYYFGSKNGLLLELLRWSEGELIEQLEVVLASRQPAEERRSRARQVRPARLIAVRLERSAGEVIAERWTCTGVEMNADVLVRDSAAVSLTGQPACAGRCGMARSRAALMVKWNGLLP